MIAAGSVLTMDMATLGRHCRRFLAWWGAELRAMLPRTWRDRVAGRSLIATVETDRVVLARRRGGAWRVVAKPSHRDLARATYLLPAAAVLIGEFDYPVPSAADLVQMLALDLDRLTPFRAEDVVFDVEILDDGRQRGGLGRIALAVVAKDRWAAYLALLAGLGIAPRAVATRDDQGRLRFDFARRGTLGGSGGRWRRRWTIAAALLIALNLLLLVWRDQLALDRLAEAVDSQRLQVQLIERVRRQVEAEEARRHELVARLQARAPLAILDALTTALPDQVWLTSLIWNGTELRLSGGQSGPADVVAVLAGSGLLTDLRRDDAPPGTFNVTATLVPIGGDSR